MLVFCLAGTAVGKSHRAGVHARLTVSAPTILTNDMVEIDPTASRWPRGSGSARLTFGDGARASVLKRLTIQPHRYARAGTFTITLTLSSRGAISVAKQRIIVKRRVMRTRLAARTRTARTSGVRSIHGSPGGRETVVLTGGGRTHSIGTILSIPVSSRAPQGVLGRIVGETLAPRGGVSYIVAPVRVDQAYRSINVATSGSLGSPDVIVQDDQGHVLRSQPTSIFRRAVSLHLGGTGMRCTGSVDGPLSIDVDLSKLHWELSFTYPSPSIHFLVTGSPTVTVNMALTLAEECHWTLPLHVVIPIPGTALQVRISPKLELTTSGSLGASFKWSPRLTYGFDRGNGISDEAHVFNVGTFKPAFAATASGDLFFGPDAELSLAGRVGVDMTFGPHFEVSRSIGTDGACEKGDVNLKVEASANADVFVKHWTFALFSGTFGDTNLFDICNKPSAGAGNGSNSGSGGSGSGTSGPSGGGSSGGSSGSSGSPVTIPSGAYPETAGGVAHTWTNYTNAGGTEGPDIGASQTVGITCRIQGFAVADGNTWWYEIGSAPWSNSYYVSADAFYNNGATSGPLKGTPFVDPNVAQCGGSAPPPPPPPPTWAETTGGVAHTWTNYTNAGGAEGPSIASNQTVQIACKLAGFKVADGNTWWYRIASSPWNGAYYVSADAFYNNGQTSGSLHGTPFVDPAVANC